MCKVFHKEVDPCERMNLRRAWEVSKSWKRGAIIWRFLEHVFAVGAFASSIAVVYISATAENDRIQIILFSSMAAILTLMNFALNPTKYMSNYRLAFETLNAALVENTGKDGSLMYGDVSWAAIVNAIKQGETYISRTFDTGKNA
jgi:hypothetical protein